MKILKVRTLVNDKNQVTAVNIFINGYRIKITETDDGYLQVDKISSEEPLQIQTKSSNSLKIK